MENEKNHIIPYRTFLFVLAGLIVLTLTSVFAYQISLGTLTVAIALIIAAVKSTFVLRIFMHLKFENRMLEFATIGVVSLLAVVIIITLLDYLKDKQYVFNYGNRSFKLCVDVQYRVLLYCRYFALTSYWHYSDNAVFYLPLQ